MEPLDILALVYLGVSTFVWWRLVRGLRRRHAELWRELGAPTTVDVYYVFRSATLKTARYAWVGDWRRLRDPEVSFGFSYVRFLTVVPALVIGYLLHYFWAS